MPQKVKEVMKKRECALMLSVAMGFLRLVVADEVSFAKYLRKLVRRGKARQYLMALPKEERLPSDEGTETALAEEELASFLLDPPTPGSFIEHLEARIITAAKMGRFNWRGIERDMNRRILGG